MKEEIAAFQTGEIPEEVEVPTVSRTVLDDWFALVKWWEREKAEGNEMAIPPSSGLYKQLRAEKRFGAWALNQWGAQYKKFWTPRGMEQEVDG